MYSEVSSFCPPYVFASADENRGRRITVRVGATIRQMLVRRRTGRRILEVNGLTWTRREFCQGGWLISGAKHTGKTTGALAAIFSQLFTRERRWGGIFVAPDRGPFALLRALAQHVGRRADCVTIGTNGDARVADPQRPTINLLGDDRVPAELYARTLLHPATDTPTEAVANSEARREARLALGAAIELLRASRLAVTAPRLLGLLTVHRQFDPDVPAYQAAIDHFASTYLVPRLNRPGQLAEVVALAKRAMNWLAAPLVSRMLCAESPTLGLSEIDRGKLMFLDLPGHGESEYRLAAALLKVGFHIHALDRLRRSDTQRPQDNLLVFCADECLSHLMQPSHSEVLFKDDRGQRLCEASAAVVAVCTDYEGFVRALRGADAARLFTRSLGNWVVLRPASETMVAEVAERLVGQPLPTTAAGLKIVPRDVRELLVSLPNFHGLILHHEGGQRRAILPPYLPDGSLPPWYSGDSDPDLLA